MDILIDETLNHNWRRTVVLGSLLDGNFSRTIKFCRRTGSKEVNDSRDSPDISFSTSNWSFRRLVFGTAICSLVVSSRLSCNAEVDYAKL